MSEKLNTVNVVQVLDGVISIVASYIDSVTGNVEAEKCAIEKMEEKCDLSDDDKVEFIKNGHMIRNGYEISLLNSGGN